MDWLGLPSCCRHRAPCAWAQEKRTCVVTIDVTIDVTWAQEKRTCVVTIDVTIDVTWAQEKRTCVVAARLDNLGKGASGAAVQNLNIAMGIDEKTGL